MMRRVVIAGLLLAVSLSLEGQGAEGSAAPWPAVVQSWGVPSDGNTLVLADPEAGNYAFRNRWQDGDDISFAIRLGTKPGSPTSTGGPILWSGFGKSGALPGGYRNCRAIHFETVEDGSASLSINTAGGPSCVAVDFSRASGAEAILILTGPGSYPMKPPAGESDSRVTYATVSLSGRTFHLMLFGTEGRPPVEPHVSRELGEIVVGEQAIRFDGEKIILRHFGRGPRFVGRVPITRSGDPLPLQGVLYIPTDPEAPLTATVSYRSAGEKEFRTLPLERADEFALAPDQRGFQAMLPGAATMAGEVEYFFSFREGDGAEVAFPAHGATAPLRTTPDAKAPALPKDPEIVSAHSYLVHFSWAPAEDDLQVAGYRVYRRGAKDEPGQETLLGELKPNQLQFRDPQPEAGKEVVYLVEPWDAAGRAGERRGVSLLVPRDAPPQAALSVSALSVGKAIQVGWRGTVEPDVVRLKIERAPADSDDFATVANIDRPQRAPAWIDADVTKGERYRYRLTLIDAAGLEGNATLPVEVVAGEYLRRINCGGPMIVGADGIPWEADDSSLAGTGTFTAKTPVADAPEELQMIYRTERWSQTSLRYRFEVAPQRYQVTLLFAETNPNFQAAGKRTFDVLFNNEIRHEKVDIFEQSGANRAWRLTTTIDVAPQPAATTKKREGARSGAARAVTGALNVELRKNAAGPALKGIEVQAIPSEP